MTETECEDFLSYCENLFAAHADLVEAAERWQYAYRRLEAMGVDLTHFEYAVGIPAKADFITMPEGENK